MGCAGSSLGVPAAEPTVEVADIRPQLLRHLPTEAAEKIWDMFAEYRRESMLADGEGGQRGSIMSRECLRRCLRDVSDSIFELLWILFDWDGSGSVDADEFMMAMALLCTGVSGSTTELLEAAFCMFDTDKSGRLARAEFEAMLQATINLNLSHLLDSNQGAAAFGAQLQKEYSGENLAFWQAVRAYRALTDDAERLRRAREVAAEFVEEGAPSQVNLPSSVASALGAALKESERAAEAPAGLFDRASDEIFSLMEKDTFSRFKADAAAIGQLIDECFAAAGVGEGEEVCGTRSSHRPPLPLAHRCHYCGFGAAAAAGSPLPPLPLGSC